MLPERAPLLHPLPEPGERTSWQGVPSTRLRGEGWPANLAPAEQMVYNRATVLMTASRQQDGGF